MKRFAVYLVVALLVVCIGLVGFASPAQAALAFHSGFEIGDFSEWSSVSGSPSVVEDVLGEYYMDPNDEMEWIYGDNWKAQTFTPSSNFIVTHVIVKFYVEGSPSGDFTTSIKATDGSGHPTGSDLVFVTVNANTLVVGDNNKFIFPLPYTLSGSTKYALVLRHPTGDIDNHLRWYEDSTGDYTGGNFEDTSDGGDNWNAVSGSDFRFRIATTPKTGDYAMKCDTTGGATTAYILGAAWQYNITFYMYVAVAPDADVAIGGGGSSSLATSIHLKLTTDRHIDLYYSASKEVDGTTLLSLNTWYRISLSVETTGTTGSYYYINGVEEGSTTEFNLIYGNLGIGESCTADIYFDDFASDFTPVDGGQDLGDIRVLRAMPNAVGEYAQYDISSGYTNVNSWPNSDASFIEDEGADAARESYNIEGTSDLGIGGSDTINAVNVFIRGDRDGGGGTDHMAMVRDDSVDYNSADLDFDGIAWYSWYHADLPNGGAPWTVDRFNALQIGAYHLGAQDQRVHSVLAMVAYTVSAVGADISNTPSSKAFGVVAANTTYWSSDSEPTWPLVDGDAYFTVTNNSSGSVSIAYKATNFTGGVGWTLTTGSPGENTVRMTVFIEGDGSGDGDALTTGDQTLISSLGASSDTDWEIKFETGTFTDPDGKTSTVTLTGTLL